MSASTWLPRDFCGLAFRVADDSDKQDCSAVPVRNHYQERPIEHQIKLLPGWDDCGCAHLNPCGGGCRAAFLVHLQERLVKHSTDKHTVWIIDHFGKLRSLPVECDSHAESGQGLVECRIVLDGKLRQRYRSPARAERSRNLAPVRFSQLCHKRVGASVRKKIVHAKAIADVRQENDLIVRC